VKLTFVIASLGSGGAERVMSIMANYFAERGDEVSIVTFDDGSTPPFFDVSGRVRWHPLDTAPTTLSMASRLIYIPRRAWALRRQIRANRPEAIVSFMDRVNLMTLAATIGMRAPVIVSERSDPRQQDNNVASGLLRRLLYRRARAIVVQTNGAASYFASSSLRTKTLVIPNPVPQPPISLASSGRPGASIMAMGRLSGEKGFDLLLTAFASVADRFPDWTLTIWGDGTLRGSLESQRDDLGLGARVRMPGRTKTPGVPMRAADIFVLSSHYEGFPNVLAEAMANGAAVISYDCPSGPADLIESGVNGLLVAPESVEALADAMAALMSDGAERRRLGANAERVTDAFSLERVMAMWESIIDSPHVSS